MTRLFDKFKRRMESTTPAWAGLVVVIFLIAQAYVLMEWIFYVTKPSFLDLYAPLEKLKIVFVCGGLAAALSLLVLEPLPAVFLCPCQPAASRNLSCHGVAHAG